jgi:hypothetical protein
MGPTFTSSIIMSQNPGNGKVIARKMAQEPHDDGGGDDDDEGGGGGEEEKEEEQQQQNEGDDSKFYPTFFNC